MTVRMVRLTVVLMVIFVVALPVFAERPLTPVEIESLPFDSSLNANTQTLYQEHVEHTEPQVREAKKAGLPQFDVTTFPSQIFWLAIMFVVLYVYFAKGALPKLSKVIEKRHATISSDLEQAEKISQDVEKTRSDYEEAMKKAHDEARKTIADVEQHLKADADNQAEIFKDKSAKAILDLEDKMASLKAKIKAELDNVAVDLTSDIIAQLTPLSVKEADIENAVSKWSD